MKSSSLWMSISGGLGFGCFLIANFTHLFRSSSKIAAVLQLAINLFVFIAWSYSFFTSDGLKKFIAFFGIVVPIVMATITIRRILLKKNPPR